MADEIVAIVLEDLALELFLGDSQFDEATLFQGMLEAFAEVQQDNEDTLIEILRQRDIDNAEGAQLNQWGDIVGELRRTHTDESYRKFIRARISINDSEGDPERLIFILKTLTEGAKIRLIEHPFATVEMIFLKDVLDSEAGLFPGHLDEAAVGGVRVWPIIEAPLDCFFLDDINNPQVAPNPLGELDDINNAGDFSDLCKIVTSDLQFTVVEYSSEYSIEYG